MKKTMLFALLLAQYTLVAQETAAPVRKINAHYLWAATGANISVSYQFRYKKVEPFVGLMYHINTPVNDLNYHVFRHRFYNKTVTDGIGLNFGVVAPVALRNSDVGLYFLYIAEVNHMNNRFITGSQSGFAPDYISRPPMWITENGVGVGINVKVYDRFYLNASAAGGVATYTNGSGYENPGTWWELSYQCRAGVSYLLPVRS